MRTNTTKILIIYCLCFFFLTKLTNAQIGIGIKTPHPSAVLELKADNKGLLIPRVTTSSREALTGAATSLLVFDINQNMFYYYYSGKWYALNEWKTEAVSTATPYPVTSTMRGNVGIGTTTPSEKLQVQGNAKVSGNITANTFSGYGTIPVGGIIMWNGSSPPSGWALCDGSSGTPDLRGKFIAGYNPSNSSYGIGAKGGEEKHTLTVSEMPAHNHSATVSTDGLHSHGMQSRGFDVDGWDDHAPVAGSSNDISTHAAGAHTHTVTIGSTGSGSPHENRPPYYVLAYIMRVY